MKRAVAISWLALCELVAGFLLIVWLTQPTGTTFWQLAKGLTATVACASPAIKYIRSHPKPRKELENKP